MRRLSLAVGLVAAVSLLAGRARAEEPEGRRTVPVSALVTAGLAVVALGTGAVFGALAWQDHEDFQSHPNAATANRGESRGLTADMCFGGAATLAVVSVVMLFTHEGEASGVTAPKEAGGQVSVAPFVTPHGAGAGAVVRF